jgi:hypothetical protein
MALKDKVYLVELDGQFGKQYQIWYEDKGSFIGCKGQEPVNKIALPDPGQFNMESWSIKDALQYVKAIQ